MKSMILAAGRGERLRPLTDQQPKPLLPIAGVPMIERTVCNLVAHGITDIIINLSYKGELIRDYLKTGKQLGARLSYSEEGPEALETAGGILNALWFFEDQPFLVVNGDVYTDYCYAHLRDQTVSTAHLVLVPNPDHHPQGDFGLLDRNVVNQAQHMLTFAGIGIYHPGLFDGLPQGRMPLGPLLRQAIETGQVTGEYHDGLWMDIGTLERYQRVNQLLCDPED